MTGRTDKSERAVVRASSSRSEKLLADHRSVPQSCIACGGSFKHGDKIVYVDQFVVSDLSDKTATLAKPADEIAVHRRCLL